MGKLMKRNGRLLRQLTSLISMMVVLNLLIGCSLLPNTGSKTCPGDQGESCTSLSEIDKRTQQIGFSKNENFEVIKPLLMQGHAHAYHKPVQRAPEQVRSVWFAPFVDESGHFHHESYVDIVIKPGHWSITPVNRTGVTHE